MKISIHVATPHDAAAIADLVSQLGYLASEQDAAARIASHTSPSYLLLIAKKEDQPVGYIALHVYQVLHFPAPEGRITSFCVDKKSQGLGIGNDLLQAAENFFREKGCYRIVFNSNLKRISTHQYYLNRGYQFTSKHFTKLIENPVAT